jgi:hypothetical protein
MGGDSPSPAPGAVASPSDVDPPEEPPELPEPELPELPELLEEPVPGGSVPWGEELPHATTNAAAQITYERRLSQALCDASRFGARVPRNLPMTASVGDAGPTARIAYARMLERATNGRLIST